MGWRVFSRRMVPIGNRVVIVLGAGYRGIEVSGIGRILGVAVLGCYGIGAGMGARWFSTGTRIFSPLKGHGIYSGFHPRQRKFDDTSPRIAARKSGVSLELLSR